MRKERVMLLIGLLIGLLILSGCIHAKEKELQETTVKLKWIHQAQFAGIYVASEKGFYEEEGLDVEIIPYSFDTSAMDSLSEGIVDFAVIGSEQLLLKRSQGIELTAFAVIYKTDPYVIYSLKEKKIVKPQDMLGKTIGLRGNSETNYFRYLSMINNLNIDRSKINEVLIKYGEDDDLIKGTIDLSSGYIINEPQILIEQGYELNMIMPSEYGVNIYSDVLATRQEIIDNNPQLVEKFLRATMKGWQYTIENQDEAVDIVLRFTGKDNKIHETHMLESSIPLIHTGDSPLGWMEKSRWVQTQDILLNQKILDKSLEIDEVYTMQFLEKIYERGN